MSVALLCGCLVLPAWAQTTRPDRPGSIAGRVLRPDGIPQPDAEVVAATRGRDGRLRLSPWRARTAFDGQYAITGVPPGRYLVLVRVVGADAPVEGRPHATLFPGVPTTEPGTAVDVFAGVPLEGVDIWLQPAPRRFQVAGRVLDPRGRPLENIAIEFGPAGSRADNVWTLSDPGGLFTLDRVPPGPVVLRARADSPDGTLVGVASVVLAVESAQDLRLEVREPGRVRGRVGRDNGRAAGGASGGAPPHDSSTVRALPGGRGSRGRVRGFEVTGTVGEHELIVRGLPVGWGIRGVPSSVWLNPGEAIGEVRVEIGPIASRRRT